MNLPSISARQWQSAGRHVVTFFAGAALGVAGVAAYGVSFHFVNGGQADSIVAAFKDLSTGVAAVVNGLGTIAGALATLIGIASGLWAAYSASKKSMTQAVAAIPGTTVVTTPALAAATPDQPNIVSNTKNAVVPK
jgi:hypothetical protein